MSGASIDDSASSSAFDRFRALVEPGPVIRFGPSTRVLPQPGRTTSRVCATMRSAC